MRNFLNNRVLLYGGLYALGVLSGVLLGYYAPSRDSEAFIIREPKGKYQFVRPLIGFSVGEKKEFEELFSLKRKLQYVIDTARAQKKIVSASAYFRDMESGRWTGVHEDELYAPASLYKVALMLGILKRAETDLDFLDEKITFLGSTEDETPDYTPMNAGQRYSIRELLVRLITLSDDDARNMLRAHLDQKRVSDVFYDLGLTEPKFEDEGDSMSARIYSRFFRTLYNATYLNREFSEYALNILSQTTFNSGIVNGMPEEARKLPIAHKFGYRLFEEPVNGVLREIHDCGIIYYPEHPYFLCIMTKGSATSKPEDLFDVIQTLSKTAYEEVQSLNES